MIACLSENMLFMTNMSQLLLGHMSNTLNLDTAVEIKLNTSLISHPLHLLLVRQEVSPDPNASHWLRKCCYMGLVVDWYLKSFTVTVFTLLGESPTNSWPSLCTSRKRRREHLNLKNTLFNLNQNANLNINKIIFKKKVIERILILQFVLKINCVKFHP